MFVVLRRGSLQVYGQCRRNLLTAAGVRQVVRGDVLLETGSGTDTGPNVVWFVLGREIDEGRLAVGAGAHRVVMVGLWDRPMWHFSVFVAAFAAGTGSAGATAAAGAATAAGTGVNPFHLPGSIQNQLDTVRTLVVDTSATNGLRKVVDHGPRHARQIAQVTVLTLRLYGHFDPRVTMSPPKWSIQNNSHFIPLFNKSSLRDDPEHRRPSLQNRVVIHAELH